MGSKFTKLTYDRLSKAIIALLSPKVIAILKDRGPGHCMRVTDLGSEVMESLCYELRKLLPDSSIYILGSHDQADAPHVITSTKLVELRNPLADGKLRPPLLVFIPTSLKTSAEDSFGIATFEELSFASIYDDLKKHLLEQIPSTLVGHIRELFAFLDEEDWAFADELAKSRYLLTSLENGVDGDTLGASLYELALIPDFKLFVTSSSSNAKILRNIDSVRTIMASHKSSRGRIADLGLSDKELCNRLNTFFKKYDVHEPEVWTAPIALEQEWWVISFDKWNFLEELVLDEIQLNVLKTDLPTIQENEAHEQLSELIGQQVLVPKERRKMTVTFEVSPHPKKVTGLDHFTVQIMSNAGGPVGKTKKVQAWTPKRTSSNVSLTKLDKIEFEEGWHYVRVLPWTAAGDPIPLIDGSTPDDSRRLYESEPFYVLPSGSIEEEPPQRAIPYEDSVEHAKFRLQLTAIGDNRDPNQISISSISWADGAKMRRSSRQQTLVAKFGREGAVQITILECLRLSNSVSWPCLNIHLVGGCRLT